VGAVRAIVTGMLAALLVVGCAPAPGPVTLRTQAPLTVCDAARVGGVLVADPSYGLAFLGGDHVEGVVWPNGYSARREQDGVVVLVDPSGLVVAREGDRIVAAGAIGEDGIAYPECDLEMDAPGMD
jgi:type IV pilus biogenesis protein CpaD/CtpE